MLDFKANRPFFQIENAGENRMGLVLGASTIAQTKGHTLLDTQILVCERFGFYSELGHTSSQGPSRWYHSISFPHESNTFGNFPFAALLNARIPGS
jgi:hypothetical protein